MRVSLVGGGRVGASLAGWLAASGATLATFAGRAAAPERARALGFAAADAAAALASAGDDLLLVAVPDAALDAVAAELAARPQAAVVLHTSGSRGAGALAALRGPGAGSLHPLRAFPAPL